MTGIDVSKIQPGDGVTLEVRGYGDVRTYTVAGTAHMTSGRSQS